MEQLPPMRGRPVTTETGQAIGEGAPLDGRVRPRAWALPIPAMAGGGDYLRSSPTVDRQGEWHPLYGQDGIAAAVAAERERCGSLARAAMSHAKEDDWKRVNRLLAAIETPNEI